MTEENTQIIDESFIDMKVNQLRHQMASEIADLKQGNLATNSNFRVTEMAQKIDGFESKLNNLTQKGMPILDQVDEKIENLEKRVTTMNDKVLPIVLENSIPDIKDGDLKALYKKCNDLTYDLIAAKLNMTQSGVSHYINDRNVNAEGRRKIHKFLMETLKNASL